MVPAYSPFWVAERNSIEAYTFKLGIPIIVIIQLEMKYIKACVYSAALKLNNPYHFNVKSQRVIIAY